MAARRDGDGDEVREARDALLELGRGPVRGVVVDEPDHMNGLVSFGSISLPTEVVGHIFMTERWQLDRSGEAPRELPRGALPQRGRRVPHGSRMRRPPLDFKREPRRRLVHGRRPGAGQGHCDDRGCHAAASERNEQAVSSAHGALRRRHAQGRAAALGGPPRRQGPRHLAGGDGAWAPQSRDSGTDPPLPAFS